MKEEVFFYDDFLKLPNEVIIYNLINTLKDSGNFPTIG